MKDDLKNKHLLVVDDENSVLEFLFSLLKKNYTVHLAKNLSEARSLLDRHLVEVVLLDIRIGKENGLEFLKEIKAVYHDNVEVIILSAIKEVQTAVSALKFGAFDYLTKDFEYDDLINRVQKAIQLLQKNKEIQYLSEEIQQKRDVPLIFGSSPEMQRVQTVADCVAPLPTTILIYGETGSGKELMARYIHHKSHLADKPFVTVNAAAIPSELLESTLFGHEKGAFTGAIRTHQGKFELANGGTLFLDEIGELRLDLQSKLLRVLQENEIERVGGHKIIPVNIRLITATNANLKEKVNKKEFREDLYYRLNVVPIQLPPLRNRAQDIPELLIFFVKHYSRKFNRNIGNIAPEVERVLCNYSWPGNIRELEHLVERMVALSHKEHLNLSDIPLEYQIGPLSTEGGMIDSDQEDDRLQKTLDAFEKTFLLRTLEENSWNQTLASKRLGIHRKTLEYKIKRLGLGESIEFERLKS